MTIRDEVEQVLAETMMSVKLLDLKDLLDEVDAARARITELETQRVSREVEMQSKTVEMIRDALIRHFEAQGAGRRRGDNQGANALGPSIETGVRPPDGGDAVD